MVKMSAVFLLFVAMIMIMFRDNLTTVIVGVSLLYLMYIPVRLWQNDQECRQRENEAKNGREIDEGNQQV